MRRTGRALAALLAAAVSPALGGGAPRVEVDREEGLRAANAGLAAFNTGRYTDALALLDVFTRIVESLGYGATEGAASRKYSHEDAEKVFKGEAHEQCFVYLAKGLSYLATADAGRARACFKAMQFYDVYYDLSNQKMSDDDWASAHYLEGYAAYLLGEPAAAEEAYRRSRERSLLPLPRYGSTQRLAVVLAGKGPLKKSEGEFKEFLRYNDPGQDYIALLGQPPLLLADDVLYQATTRGKRQVDAFLAGKAITVRGAATAARGLLMVSESSGDLYRQTGNRAAGAVAGVAAFASLISAIVSSSGRPAADVRQVDGLPRHVAIVEIPSGTTTLRVQKVDAYAFPKSQVDVPVRLGDDFQIVTVP